MNNNTKVAGYSPALLADDAMDMYMQYTLAKKRLDSRRRRGSLASQQVPSGTTKQAGLEQLMERGIEKVLDNPSMLIPSPSTVKTVGTGVAASMYGPEWTFGPSEQEIAAGKRFNLKRALTAVATTGILGNAVARMPESAYGLATSPNLSGKLQNGVNLALGGTAAALVGVPLAKGNTPDLKKALKRYFRASNLALPVTAYTAIASNETLANAIKNMFDAANSRTPAAHNIPVPYRG